MNTKVVTNKVRLSYVHVFEPYSVNGATPKYSASIIVSKSDKETVSKIKDAIKQAYIDGEAKLKGSSKTVPPLEAIHSPLRDGDLERPDDPAYVGCYFLNANNSTKPGVVDADLNDILDPNEIYSGVYGRVSVVFYAYSANGNRGIACSLQNIQKLEDGEHLGGKSTAKADFGEYKGDFLD